MTFSEIKLAPEQVKAIEQIIQWRDTDEPEFKLGGYAGTGKTTVIKTIANAFKNQRIAITAYTGKAVSILRKKGCPDAQTLHSLLYTPRQTKEGLEFILRDDLGVDFIICDEASMVSRSIYDDLMSFNIPVLWVGDPGQLEPIGDDVGLMKKPNITLLEIHRQGEGSQILTFATHVRSGEIPKNFIAEQMEVLLKPKSRPDTQDCEQILCGFNKTRVSFNHQYRKFHKLLDQKINIGERIICLRNNRKLGIFNGQQFVVNKVQIYNNSVIRINCTDDLGNSAGPFMLYVPQLNHMQTIDGYEVKKAAGAMHIEELGLFDYGYCLTTHKSQGSEWDSVAVIEEIWHEKWDARRWRYTAATRAAKKLLYFY